MEIGEGATGGGDPREHMLAHLHTQLTATETWVEDLEVEVAVRDVQLFALELELTVELTVVLWELDFSVSCLIYLK